MSEEAIGDLTEAGRRYSLDLARFVGIARDSQTGNTSVATSLSAGIGEREVAEATGRSFLVLAGTETVHAETILHLRMLYPCYTTPLLNELRGGDLHGISPETIASEYPEEYRRRKDDKLHYRYPGAGGESYLDVIERLRPVVIELERQRRSALVVCNVAVLRCIYAYFSGKKLDDIPFIQVNKHRLLELTPGPFGCAVREIDPSVELSHM
jgi:broad specificity phosphatase PhoE